jgi:hypothetical protein
MQGMVTQRLDMYSRGRRRDVCRQALLLRSILVHAPYASPKAISVPFSFNGV